MSGFPVHWRGRKPQTTKGSMQWTDHRRRTPPWRISALVALTKRSTASSRLAALVVKETPQHRRRRSPEGPGRQVALWMADQPTIEALHRGVGFARSVRQ
jgi:hypothetical protein